MWEASDYCNKAAIWGKPIELERAASISIGIAHSAEAEYLKQTK